MRIDFSRPDLIFLIIWGVVLCFAILLPLPFLEPVNNRVTTLVSVNIISFILIYPFISWVINPNKIKKTPTNHYFEIYVLSKFIKSSVFIWFTLYILNIIGSGGLPFFWIILGDSRTYVDYGLPTYSGLVNMYRAFLFAGSIVVFIKTRKKLFKYICFLLFFTTFLEMSRGGMTVLLMHGVGAWFLSEKFKIKKLFTLFSILLVFVLSFGFLADFRGSHMGVEQFIGDNSILSNLPTGFFWFYAYIVTPLNNLNYAASLGLEPLYMPFFTAQSLLPTVIRELVFQTAHRPFALANEAFNVTSFYGPMLADFGFFGAGFLVFFLQVLTSYVHIRAKSGHIFHYLVYPVLFMCVILSVFSLFFFSMVTIMYPILGLIYMGYRSKVRRSLIYRSYHGSE